MNSPYAPRSSRLGAFLADVALLYLFHLGGAWLGVALAHALGAEKSVLQAMLWGWFFWGFTFWFLNYGVLQGLSGSSFGKRLFSISVVRLDGSRLGLMKSLCRSGLYVLSMLPGYLGFLSIFLSDRSQCLHDVISETVVIRTDAAFPAVGATPEQTRVSDAA